MSYNNRYDIGVLAGQTIKKITGARPTEDRIDFEMDDLVGTRYVMMHHQDCCENVQIEDIIGDIDDLIGSPITMAEEATNSDAHPEGKEPGYSPESFTWTFYRLATVKGYVTIRWLGTSNGYYSEGVSFEKM